MVIFNLKEEETGTDHVAIATSKCESSDIFLRVQYLCQVWIALLHYWRRFLNFVSSARAHERARVLNVRDFPQTKTDSEINPRFLLNEHGDPHFLFYKFNENNIPNSWEKNRQKSMATFLANEINATDRDVTGPTEKVQIMFSLKDKNIN